MARGGYGLCRWVSPSSVVTRSSLTNMMLWKKKCVQAHMQKHIVSIHSKTKTEHAYVHIDIVLGVVHFCF